MFSVSRRQTFALGASAVISSLINGRTPVRAAESGTLTIAFNVNLPSFDPTSGPSAVNPTIQTIYRSIFDQLYWPERRPLLRARPAHRLGLEPRSQQSLDGRAAKRHLA